MNQKQIEIIKKQLHISGGRVTTTSMAVAEGFGKEHKHVLRDIEALGCSPEFNRSNFRPISYKDSYGREQRAYELTKNGFMFLAMGYTGPLAAQLKELYIAAFDQMERVICSGMAEVREQAAIAMAAIMAATAREGYGADFIPRLIHLRRAGLSCSEVGKVLDVHGSTVASWSRRLREAGIDFPRLSRNVAAYAQGFGGQLALPGVQQ